MPGTENTEFGGMENYTTSFGLADSSDKMIVDPVPESETPSISAYSSGTFCKNVPKHTKEEENPPAQKAFLKNLGSNFVLKDRTLSFSYASPFHLVAQSDPIKNWLPFAG
jgi:hypothetical protein